MRTTSRECPSGRSGTSPTTGPASRRRGFRAPSRSRTARGCIATWSTPRGARCTRPATAGDTFLWGELAPRDTGSQWGVFAGMAPLVFLRAMFCVDASYRPLRGGAAAIRGCPTTPAASRSFRAQNPALFAASGVSDHAYMRWYAPNDEQDPSPDFTSLGQIGNLEHALDRLQRVYGSARGIRSGTRSSDTSPTRQSTARIPPRRRPRCYLSPSTAAYYDNWAEYISWRDPRIASFFQYLLRDTLPATAADDWGGYASGLLNFNGSQKLTYSAWQLPLYLPVTTAAARRRPRGVGLRSPGPLRDPRHGRAADGLDPAPARIARLVQDDPDGDDRQHAQRAATSTCTSGFPAAARSA